MRPTALACSLVVVLGVAAGGGAVRAQEPAAAPPAGEEGQEPAAASKEEAAPAAQSSALPSFFATTTVTATGHEADSFEIATPVTVIPAEEIARRQPDNAADLLRDEPGVDVNGVGPNQARPIIRGQRGLRVLFLENGLRLNNARRQTDFGEIPGLISLDSVSAVEVVRGPASVLYGSDAIGGVLNLITRWPPHRPAGASAIGGSAGLRYGSAGDRQGAQASIDGRFDRFSFTLGASYRDAGDYEAAAGTYGDITLDDATRVHDTGVRDDSVYGSLLWELADRHRLSLRLNRYRADETGFGFVEPGAFGQPEDFRIRIFYPFQDFDRYTLGYTGSALESALADSVEAQLYFQSNERRLANDIDIDIGPIFPGAPPSSIEIDTLNFTDLDTWGARAEAVKVVGGGRHVVTYGAEVYRDDSFNTDTSTTVATIRFPFPPFEFVDTQTSDRANAPNAVNESAGVFVQDEIAAGDRLAITVGGRWQRVKTAAESTPGWEIAGLDFSDTAVVGALNVLYRATEHVHLVGSLGSAFRAPNIIERLFNGPTPEGAGFQILNPDLTSEKSVNVDLGLKYRRRDAWFEAIYFDNEIRDGILQEFLSDEEIAALPPDVRAEIEASGFADVVQERNVDKLRYQGVEVTIGYRAANGLSAGGNYTHLSAKRTGRAPVPVEDHFSDKVNAYVRWQPPRRRWWVEYRLRHNGDEKIQLDPDQAPPPIGDTLPAFTLHALAGGVTLFERGSQRHELTVVLDNLTDELYSEFSNASFFRPEPGRSAGVSYRVGF